ncbi:GMFB protein [Pelomyxa schiedti]|nr:GMFB protein [Pelomyxa schiedti]
MSGGGICQPVEEVLAAYKKFKAARNLSDAALIMKIDIKTLKIILDCELNPVTLEELRESLPDASPRYIAYVYKQVHGDGRVSYPMMFIYYAPPQLRPDIAMMYSSSLQPLYTKLAIQKVFELQTPEELTDEWIRDKLAIFG